MNERKEALVKLENDAKTLVDSLKVLKEETSSYKSAKQELSATRESLQPVISKMEGIAIEIQKQIATLNQIGSADIYARLQTIEKHTKGNNLRAIITCLLVIVSAIGIAVAIFLYCIPKR